MHTIWTSQQARLRDYLCSVQCAISSSAQPSSEVGGFERFALGSRVGKVGRQRRRKREKKCAGFRAIVNPPILHRHWQKFNTRPAASCTSRTPEIAADDGDVKTRQHSLLGFEKYKSKVVDDWRISPHIAHCPARRHVSRSRHSVPHGAGSPSWHSIHSSKMRRKAIGRANCPAICHTALAKQDNEGDGPRGSRRLQQDDQGAEHLAAAKDGKRRVLQGRRGAAVSRFARPLRSNLPAAGLGRLCCNLPALAGSR